MVSIWVRAASNYSVDRFTNNKDLKFGFRDNSYLFWKGDSSDIKNCKFRYKKARGDHFWIEKRSDLEEIGTCVGALRCLLYWNGDSGNDKIVEAPIAEYFSINIAKIFKSGFFMENLWWLLLEVSWV